MTDVLIPRETLERLVRAEAGQFAERSTQSLALQEVIAASTPLQAAELAHAALPVRYAQRIRQIEELPGWQESPELADLHRLYSKAFRDVRLVDPSGETAFAEVIKANKVLMKGVVQQAAQGICNLQRTRGFSEGIVNKWLDAFLLSRIGTEMLTSQYLAVRQQAEEGARPGHVGIVDTACNPVDVCRKVIGRVQGLTRRHFARPGAEADVRIEVETTGAGSAAAGEIRFPYVPHYLFYILTELLKNSARATVESVGGDFGRLRDLPITITLTACPSQVAIRIHDMAGGIPFSVNEHVWSYMYSTLGVDGKPGALAGHGVGLPLSRLYAKYLGGSLHLMSMPGLGTEAFLYLRGCESKESLPREATLDEAVDRAVKQADLNGDSMISREEFRRWLRVHGGFGGARSFSSVAA